MQSDSDYLEERANVAKKKDKRGALILMLIYLGVWTFSLIVFWFFTSASAALGYSVIFLLMLIPVTTFVISLLIGINNYWGNWKWFSALAFGVMYMLAEYGTFSTANMIAFNKINSPDFGMILGGGMISLVGLAIGFGVNRLKSKHSS